jgi:peptidoglycan lytic transglycosylase
MRKIARPKAVGISRLWIYVPAAALLLAAGYATLGSGDARETPDAALATSDAPLAGERSKPSSPPLPTAKPALAPEGHHAAATQLAPEAAEMGLASWYDIDAAETANGESMDADALTAAHPSLPLGTRVLVENVENGESVIVRINDRGPYAGDRIIDLSKAAAERIDMIKDGVATVRVRRIDDALAGTPRHLDIE